MAYHIDNTPHTDYPRFIIVGCGGTGGFLADALCRLMTGRPATIALVDHDHVEPHNLLRQNFLPQDVGRFKSQALAERLSQNYDRTIAYSTHPFIRFPDGKYPAVGRYSPIIILGCVDNAAARHTMAACVQQHHQAWLIDAGNDTNWGQILIGNTVEPHLLRNPFDGDLCHRLPAPTLQRPDILTAFPATPPDTDCAAALDLTDQDPTINFMMAAHMVHVVRRFLAGTCTFMSVHLDMELATATPHYINPESINRYATDPAKVSLDLKPT